MSIWRALEEIAQWLSIVVISLIVLKELRKASVSIPSRPDKER